MNLERKKEIKKENQKLDKNEEDPIKTVNKKVASEFKRGLEYSQRVT